MATKEMRLVGKPTTTVQEQAATMAVAILVERIRSLPKEDRDDLYELMKELIDSQSEDENKEVWSTMQEILDQKPVTLSKVECDSKSMNTLQGWTDYIGSRIRELREKAGLTQVQLAQKSGLPQSHISRLEVQKHSPSHATLQRIAIALGVDVKELDPVIDD